MFTTILKWVALCITLAGAICTSFNIVPLNIYLLNLGSVLYATWGYRIREPNLVIVNGGLLAIYLMGIAHHHGLINIFNF